MDLGLSHRQLVLVLYGFCILLGAVAMVLTYLEQPPGCAFVGRAHAGGLLLRSRSSRLRALHRNPGFSGRSQAEPRHARHAPAAWPPTAAASRSGRDVAGDRRGRDRPGRDRGEVARRSAPDGGDPRPDVRSRTFGRRGLDSAVSASLSSSRAAEGATRTLELG